MSQYENIVPLPLIEISPRGSSWNVPNKSNTVLVDELTWIFRAKYHIKPLILIFKLID
jgi:hypothetical protein